MRQWIRCYSSPQGAHHLMGTRNMYNTDIGWACLISQRSWNNCFWPLLFHDMWTPDSPHDFCDHLWGLHLLAFLRLWPMATVSTHVICALLQYNLYIELNPSLVFTRNPSTIILSWVLDFIKDLEVTGKVQNTKHVVFHQLLFPPLIPSLIPLPPRLLP